MAGADDVRIAPSPSVAELINSLGLSRTGSSGNINGRLGSMTPSNSMTQAHPHPRTFDREGPTLTPKPNPA
eukprot:1285448-Prymnesium_polylepis.1